MPINFPNSPSPNQQYTYDNKTWEWNGTYWEVYSALTSYITSAYTVGNGYSDISGVTGGNIVLKSFSGVNINIIDGGDTLTFSGNNGNITGNGTTNYLPKWTGSTGLGNSLIYDDGTNLGIGTSSPLSKLDVSITGGTIGVRISGDSSSDMLRVTQTGSGNAIVVEDSSNPDATPFVVAADGRVGIGLTAPLSSYKLHVRNGTATNSVAAAGTVATFESSGVTYITVLSPDSLNGGLIYGSNSDRFGAYHIWNHDNNALYIATAKSGATMRFLTDEQTEQMRIDSSGNVGIGTTSPSAKLDINVSTGGTIGVRISGDSSSDMLRITQTGSGNAILVEDSSNPDSTPFVVTSGGTVGIGTTSPSYFLEAISTGGVDAVMMFDGGTAANANLIARADTTQKLPVVVMSDRNSTYGVATSFYIGLDRSPSSLFAGRNDSIYVNNYTDKGHYFVTANSGGTKAIKMSIIGSGNVGIGTTTPSEKLQVNGNTIISGSLTATTISATTYQNLPVSGLTQGSNITITNNGSGNYTISSTGGGVTTTGGTYSYGTSTFTNSTGGTFNVTGFTKYFVTGSTPTGYILIDGDRWFDTNSGLELVWITDGDGSQWVQPTQGGGFTGNYLPLSGGTVTGSTNFTVGLISNTISATTYQNLPVSGLTSGSGIGITNNNNNFTITYTGSTGGSGDFLPLSGGTVTGNTVFQSGLTANTLTTFNSGFTHNNSIGVDGYSGEVVRFGAGTTYASTLYYYDSSGNWSSADSNSTSTSTGMLGIGISRNYTVPGSPTSNGILVRGFARLYYGGWATGDKLYIAANSSGSITNVAPTTSTYVVRIVGYVVNGATNLIYFCPDNTWVELV